MSSSVDHSFKLGNSATILLYSIVFTIQFGLWLGKRITDHNSHLTRLPYPLSYELAKNFQAYWNNAYETWNLKSVAPWWFLISWLYYKAQENLSFPAHFQFSKFRKFYFQFSRISPKDEEFNSRGSPRGSFRDPRIFLCQILLEKLDRFIDQVMLSHFGVRFSRLKVVLGDLKV